MPIELGNDRAMVEQVKKGKNGKTRRNGGWRGGGWGGVLATKII